MAPDTENIGRVAGSVVAPDAENVGRVAGKVAPAQRDNEKRGYWRGLKNPEIVGNVSKSDCENIYCGHMPLRGNPLQDLLLFWD